MRILIVEDEIRLAQALVQIFIKNKYAADAVYDGISGLDYALSNVYDVILLDIMLPKLDGIEVLKRLRKERIATPVLLLTAKDEIEDKVNGLDSGADDYLTKPFSTKELLARIRAMSRRRGEVTDETLHFCGTCLDLKTSELSAGGHSIKLPLKEFQIMELLLASGKKIVTKEHIIEKVWGFESLTEYNNVEVYISFIRKKLACIHSDMEIKTARGIGYFLEESHD